MSNQRLCSKAFGGIWIAENGFLHVKPNSNIDMGNNRVTNMADPHNNKDGVNLEFLYKFIWVGDLKYSASPIDMGCWFICDGRSLSTDLYPALFAVIGTSFGTLGEGLFNIPDARGTTMAGIGSNPDLSVRTMGQTTGAETITLAVTNLPAHNHTATLDYQGSHNHGGSTGTQSGAGTNSGSVVAASGSGTSFANPGSHNHSISTDGNHTHNVTVANTGSNTPFSSFQPTLFVGNLFILAYYPN